MKLPNESEDIKNRLADVIDVVVDAHIKTLQIIKALSALRKVLRDYDPEFENHYLTHYAELALDPAVSALRQSHAENVQELVAIAAKLRNQEGSNRKRNPYEPPKRRR
jgi:hypothetical protein